MAVVIKEEVKQSMQIESIVESVEIDEVTEESVTVDPIGEAVEKNDKDRMTTQLISLTKPENITCLLRRL